MILIMLYVYVSILLRWCRLSLVVNHLPLMSRLHPQTDHLAHLRSESPRLLRASVGSVSELSDLGLFAEEDRFDGDFTLLVLIVAVLLVLLGRQSGAMEPGVCIHVHHL